jgi:hypothetical protein
VRARQLLPLLAILVVIGAAGSVPWPVTGPVQRFLDRSGEGTGLAPAVERVVWVPWRSLDLTGLRLDPALPGTVRAAKVRLFPQWPWLALGQVRAEIRFEEVRWERGGEQAVRADGEGAVRVGWGEAVLEWFSLEGSGIRLKAEGRLQPGREARLLLEGAVSKDLLRAMGGMELSDPAGGAWEPFRLRVDGALARPTVQFTSRFLTFSMNVPAEASP